MTLMNLRGLSCLAALALTAYACGGSSGSSGNPDGGSSSSSGGSSGGSGSGGSSGGSSSGGSSGSSSGSSSGGAANVAPLIVDSGPQGLGNSYNVPFVSVTLCVPGTTTCQTIDHVSVDTGSTGMRVLASVLTGVSLPAAKGSDGNPLAECYTFADGYVWGSVRNADVKIGGEIAANIPIEFIGDPALTNVPSDCASTGSAEDTLTTFGSNGLIGINQIIPDCGDYCAGSGTMAGYYSCTGGTCTDFAVPVANQISNPLAFLAEDNNGAILQFGSVPAAGAATLSGQLIFGIGTHSNNALGSAKVLTVDVNGNFTTTFNGTTLPTSFLDSGTTDYAFNDSSIPGCTTNQGWDCPTSPLNLMATNTGQNNVSTTVSFTVESADTLFTSNNTAFDDTATPGLDNMTFDWGFPFFIGRSVFVAFDGKSTPGGSGPYFAY